MSKIKLCGLGRPCDIEAANALQPEYIGFVFAEKSRRYVSPDTAASLRSQLRGGIQAVGVFVNEAPETVAALLRRGVIDIAQLHGSEDEDYIRHLRTLTDRPIFKAFRADAPRGVWLAQQCSADCVLLDSGSGGTGAVFDWSLLKSLQRPYFLAGGLDPRNVQEAVRRLNPYAVDVSSGIETDGRKDAEKMKAFVDAVRAAEKEDT